MSAENVLSAEDVEGFVEASENLAADPNASGGKRKVAPGFSRNMKILGGAIGVAILIVVVVVYRSSAAISANKSQVAPVSVGGASSGMQIGGVQATKDITQPEIDRINRVATAQSEQASASGNTFIPSNLPLVSMPNAGAGGPGAGYNAQSGQYAGAQGQPSPRDQLRQQGLQVQLQAMLRQLEAPPTSSAGAYKVEAPASSASATGAAAAGGTTASATKDAASLIRGLSIFGAVLTSPLDTEKTSYISARVVSGPASGALLFGKGVVVGSEGVRITFDRMSFDGLSYAINAVALDTETSSDAMNADIDRKVFSRYVIPIFGAMGKAYMDAVARPNQQMVVSSGTVNVVTPAASAREAAAAGLGAGIDRVANAATYNGPNTAFMPAGAGIGVLILDPVLKGSGK